MNLYNPNDPNKYQKLKELIIPYTSKYTKKRYGGTGDSTYVYLKELMEETQYIYSYGVGHIPASMAFDLTCANDGKKVYLYDATVEKLPVEHSNFIFKKEHLNKDNFINHIAENNHQEERKMILKMDIECSEFEVFEKNMDLIYKHFNQISMEIHSLIEEVPFGWEIDPLSLSIKKNMPVKIAFFEQINKYYNIIHIHANNHGPIYGDFPDALEITFLRNDYPIEGRDQNTCPIKDFDHPCYEGRQDYFLDWWVKPLKGLDYPVVT
jgi:hypothetical protein